MATDTERLLSTVRLLQLVSPTLPIGAFTYSQGLEYAVEAGWVDDAPALDDWLTGQLDSGLVYLELPLLKRLYAACQANDPDALAHWNGWLLAARETRELRDEERQRGRALLTLLRQLQVAGSDAAGLSEALSQTAAVALAAVHWRIPLPDIATGLSWGWLENLVTAGVKLIPLGQTEGQRLLLRIGTRIPDAVSCALAVDDDDIGASAPALAIASALHERQYTRLFRS